MSNAVRLAPGESQLVLAVGSQNGWAFIAVRDAGPGIAAGDQERIFDRFYRSNRGGAAVPSSGERRSGLGLAIVRQIVESHSGSVAVHSAPGVGSTFVLWLPDRSLAAPDRRAAAPPADDPLGPRAEVVEA
ncbi:sensor histidine kinase [Actinopolymorpha alba]|uniref:sensor histidine kinase n=1 Tax=Actinopolymorpha alba TaxID=533267 RepID=UPI001ED99AE4|nr:sensor histidine kinase [Actinopolymorpha alba]